jgi:predicted transcriptional regulator
MDEREFELINIIGADLGANQRDLSRQMNLSLGLTNMLVGRLITKGYIRIKQLNKKKVEYILTSKGFSEKMQKSVKYTLKTIDSIGLIKRRLADILSEAWQMGSRKFYILGASDLLGIIEIVLKEKFKAGYEIVHTDVIMSTMTDGIVLICREQAIVDIPSVKTLDLIHELSKDEAIKNE